MLLDPAPALPLIGLLLLWFVVVEGKRVYRGHAVGVRAHLVEGRASGESDVVRPINARRAKREQKGRASAATKQKQKQSKAGKKYGGGLGWGFGGLGGRGVGGLGVGGGMLLLTVFFAQT